MVRPQQNYRTTFLSSVESLDQLRPLRPQSWWTICCREPFHGAATRSRDSLPMYHLWPTRVPSVRKQHCFISFAIPFHMFLLIIYCLLHQWNHRVTGYEFCNRVEPKLEPKPITTNIREGPNENTFENVVCKMKAILSWPQWVKWNYPGVWLSRK